MANYMQIILKQDINNLGRSGDIVRVRPGYARNYLFPNFLALPVSLSRIHQLEYQKNLVKHQFSKVRIQAETLRDNLVQAQVIISSKSRENGKLFGSISTRDISQALNKLGFIISHRDIEVDSPIKTIGIHSVNIKLEADLTANIAISVIQE